MSIFPQSTFYCRPCADRLNLMAGLSPPTTAPTANQVSKVEKHVRPLVLSTGKHSVLDSGSTADYDQFDSLAFAAGFLEIEPTGVRTLTYPTTSPIATVYLDGVPLGHATNFRRVLSTDPGRTHGYTELSSRYSGAVCAACGIKLVP
jgi:hypothetical protein